MATKQKRGLFESKIFDSRIKSANTQASEIWLGYFGGPMLLFMAYYSVAGTYLTQFYTDVLGLAGGFLTLMPVISKVIDAITNIIMGRIIDRTRTKQGKARPWVLIAGVLFAVTGSLLYAVPKASYQVQIIWITISYNLFFSFAFTIYNMSHTLMVPLSTRNTKQRDTLALVQNAGMNMLPGMLSAVIMPFLVAKFGVGIEAQGNWMMFMSILSILALPATIVEYYFTKERVTEDEMAAAESGETNNVPFSRQITACFKDKYWLIIMGFIAMYEIFNILQTNSMLYYCNWVLDSSVEGGAAKQALLNMLGQAPLGIGVFVLWPLVRKFGKRRVMQVGFVIAAVGSLGVMLAGSNMGMVLGCMMLKSIGAIPTMVMAAMMAEALDHIEWKNHYRADGFTAAIRSICLVVGAGIGQSIILSGIASRGYISPEAATQIIQQPDAMKSFFVWCFAGAPMIGYIIGVILMIFFDVEKKIPKISADITARHRAEAEARGEVYYSAEEKAAMEQEENDRIAEEKRIEELKAKCARKGMSFEEEEAKYQAKLAAKKAKEEAKAAKKK
ncbi:MAG: MFS transporter [Lachnospiraceae bacterium]|nr:MFS transporter [Lachnospiraceae bacterium]